MVELRLTGIRPEPLASYLAALGILRLVGEQKDASATGRWDGDTFVLSSTLDADALVDFLVREYAPTPVVGPWNGGSGFFPGDNTTGVEALWASTDDRFAPYRRVIGEVRDILATLGVETKPDKKSKSELIAQLRGHLPDDALGWIDAALVLTADGSERFPPLLGTGGNDGRLEFSNNFMQRIAELFLGASAPDPALVQGVLFETPTRGLVRAAIGQFAPSQAGGPNTTAGFDAGALVNPWGFVLMIEGALVPSGAATRRLESSRGGTMAFPFTVRAAMAGYAAAADEANREEIWFPLWSTPANHREVQMLFTEGRAKVPTRRRGRFDAREAVDGIDFARAIAALGVNRGVASFARFGFQQRNGLSFFAVPLGRWAVRHSENADLLAEIDPWLARLRGYVASGKAPASVSTAARRLENAIIESCRRDDYANTIAVLVALGATESAIGRSKDRPFAPLRALSTRWYGVTSADPSTEYRLAAALASTGLRPRLRPVVQEHGRWSWAPTQSKVMTWSPAANVVDNLIALLRRREIEEAQTERVEHRDLWLIGAASSPRCWADLADVAAFIDDERAGFDTDRFESLLSGLSLIDWAAVDQCAPSAEIVRVPPVAFGLMKLARALTDPSSKKPLPVTPGLLANAQAGRLEVASELAMRRLRGIGLRLPVKRLAARPPRARRIAAALAFPLAPATLSALRHLLFPRPDARPSFDPQHQDSKP